MARELSKDDVKNIIKRFSGAEITEQMFQTIELHVPNFMQDMSAALGNIENFERSMQKMEEMMKNKDGKSDEEIIKNLEKIEKNLEENIINVSENKGVTVENKPNKPEMKNSFGVGFKAEILEPKDIEEIIYVIINNETKEKTVVNNKQELAKFLSSVESDIDNFTIKKAKVG